MIESWHDFEPFVDVLAERVRGTSAHVVFTAHSLPARILAEGDPYQEQLLRDRAARGGARGRRRLVVQLPERVADRRAVARPRHPRPPRPTCTRAACSDVLVCPVGFVSDHLEIRWDIDVEAQERARELGMTLRRIEMPNADPRIRTRARVARQPGARCPSHELSTVRSASTRLSRRFRVRARGTNTLKSVALLRSRSRPADVWALRDVSFAVEPGSGLGARRPQRLGQEHAAPHRRGDHQADAGPRRRRRPDRHAARARRRLPSRLHRPRERLPQRLDPRAEARVHPRALRRDRRVRGARGLHRRAGAHVLVGDVHAPRLRGRLAPQRRRAAARRGVRGRRRRVPAQVPRADPRVQARRRHDRVRVARLVGGRAPVRARDPAARGTHDLRRRRHRTR